MSGGANEALIAGGDMSGVIEGQPFKIEEWTVFSIQVGWEGATVDGSLVLQASNDVGSFGDSLVRGVTTWTDVPSTTQAVTDDEGSHIYNVVGAAWRWVRVVYTPTTGTGVMAARIQTKPSEAT